MSQNLQNQSGLDASVATVTAASALAEDYLRQLNQRNVAPTPSAVRGLRHFDTPLNEEPCDPVKTLELLGKFGSPATTASAAGRFFGLVVGGTLPAALGARILTSAWDQIVFNDATSAATVKLEQVASRWLLEILSLPEACSVGFTSGATMANFTCLAAARHALLARQEWDVEKRGLNGAPPIRVIASAQVHVTVLKALAMLGIGTDAVELIPCDDNGAMRVNALPRLDACSLVLTQAGNVNSGACDPIAEISARAAEVGAWVHVDGAFGLWAAASSHVGDLLAGYGAANSWVTDGHKWLNTPYDCGIAICKSPQDIHAAMATQAPYLKVGGKAAPKDMVPEFSRSARGVEVWAALHSLGRQGVAQLIDQCCDHARAFASGLEALGFEILNDVVLNQVVATLPGREDDMSDLTNLVQRSGEAWFGPTHWKGNQAIRLSVSSWVTTQNDVERTLRAISNAMAQLDERDIEGA